MLSSKTKTEKQAEPKLSTDNTTNTHILANITPEPTRICHGCCAVNHASPLCFVLGGDFMASFHWLAVFCGAGGFVSGSTALLTCRLSCCHLFPSPWWWRSCGRGWFQLLLLAVIHVLAVLWRWCLNLFVFLACFSLFPSLCYIKNSALQSFNFCLFV